MAKTRFTERYVRAMGGWVKITRDNQLRTFCFARGYTGDVTAVAIETLTFKWVANWREAEERATRTLKIYA